MPDDAALLSNVDPYLTLGVRPFINCCSVRTLHGGSLLSEQARQAMAAASRQFVDLDELMEAAGARIAELTGAEWGLVTCGSAAALALATAACVAGNDPVKLLSLPFTDGMANRVVMMRGQRFAYDNAIRMVGTHIVEVANRAELEEALDERVAMIAVLGKSEAESAVRLEEMAALAKPAGIPVLVDAASEHLARPNPWLGRGADLVVYSGGKFLRGPQTSGLLLGSKALVQAAWRNSAPHHAFGRPMKVSKEDVAGVVAALEHWFHERDETAEQQRWRDDLDRIIEHVHEMPGVACQLVQPEGVTLVPRLAISWDTDVYAVDGEAVRQALLEGTPRIRLDDRWTWGNQAGVDPFNLQPGEAAEVGRAIAAALAGARRTAAIGLAAPTVDLTGDWSVNVKFLRGARAHTLRLQQSGCHLAGEQHSDGFNGPVSGHIAADRIRLRFAMVTQGSTILYSFEGRADPSGMEGEVEFGCAGETNDGVVNRRQYGTGRWQASRQP